MCILAGCHCVRTQQQARVNHSECKPVYHVSFSLSSIPHYVVVYFPFIPIYSSILLQQQYPSIRQSSQNRYHDIQTTFRNVTFPKQLCIPNDRWILVDNGNVLFLYRQTIIMSIWWSNIFSSVYLPVSTQDLLKIIDFSLCHSSADYPL